MSLPGAVVKMPFATLAVPSGEEITFPLESVVIDTKPR
jgi:hypothetical protein